MILVDNQQKERSGNDDGKLRLLHPRSHRTIRGEKEIKKFDSESCELVYLLKSTTVVVYLSLVD